MNLKKTGKLITVVAATAAFIASMVNDKKDKNTKEK
ncbi:hypothetical protein B0P06_002840 [Clostridium saccharoperbutylacetonicum]|uniref:Uncharacterized protein n=1 Tax=Clostridium saccharoperbutylacetonicum N1-4(HMT) TaxID=931276 RepID=M1MW53_9CLOT|nr:hypothetical protein Cspa_c50800 [Clostridium saccharoperbutylacetonicum N1-4(HMT)]AQR97512.1 hypothetical protein CLSAP_48370 [Clostridium saccharoperbutylacetonicum]NRT60385.1 hypothetical protein [Clostridium saccharoperbutylacetonicum]NSB23698.1 hypothetical protein [Clostridium saccharoperbutylacetonicum]NSB33396.1 hypothetical protein [Clostridium saccharoperbutylacetonicum]